MIDTDPTTIGTIGTVVGVVVGAFGMFRYVAGIKDTLSTRITSEAAGLSTRITSEADKADTKIDSMSRETRLLVEKLSESEAKSRSELAGTMMNAISDMRRDTKALDEKFNTMRSEMIRRSDLAETRQEIVTALERQDRARAELADKLDRKIESALLGNRARK